MADTTLVSRLVHCTKTSAAWVSCTIVPKKGELCIESTGTDFKIKVGDGVNLYKDLQYITDNNFTNALKVKLDGIAAGAEVNVQSDWNETDDTSDAFIKNKPSIPTLPTFRNLVIQDAGTNKVTYDPDGSANKTLNFKDGTNITATVDTSGNITHSFSGVLPITSGGMGSTSAAGARTNLGLGAAATKAVVTSLDNSANLPTAAAVQSAIAASFAANDAMIFKGTIALSSSSTVSANQKGLPTTYNVGWTYRVVEAGTLAGQTVEVGDLITAIVDRAGSGNANSDWTVAQTNINGAITSIGSGTDISITGSGSSRTVNHANVSRNNTTASVRPTHLSDLSVVSEITSSATGHITEVKTTTITLPADLDQKVKQNENASTVSLPILLAKNGVADGDIDEVNYTSGVSVKPSTGELTATTFIGNLTGLSAKATSATSARYATTAKNAGTANYATTAAYATSAGSANTATSATNAGTASYSTNAGTANYATNAGSANSATNASTATYATNAGTANYATGAGVATNASTAAYATNASTANYGKNAGTAAYATSAGSASSATNASTANYTTSAGTATYATNAGKLGSNAGSTAKPIYFSGGKPEAITVSAGGANHPAYVASGEIKAVTGVSTDLLVNGSNLLILDGNF